MTAVTSALRRPAPAVVLLAGFAGAVVVRASLAGPAGPASTTAGLVFAGMLALLAALAGLRTAVTRRSIVTGLVGLGVLVLPLLVGHHLTDVRPLDAYVGWAMATAVVATAEEALLRGALFDAVERANGTDAAVVVAAVAFAALHVPLYGWGAVPLDLAVGIALGALRVVARTWTAPAVAHVGADLVGWWFV